ncbi:MAG: 30S ribosomal protein S6, partial [Chloroflexia bacterium]|nr:30S ribosomal protein S6 [Chloroflexia bacterium]
MTILHPEVPEDEITGNLERISGYISGVGGTISETLRESPWGRRRLAYSIRHGGRDLRDGYYTVFHFELEPSQVREVEREIKLNERIIRYLVT